MNRRTCTVSLIAFLFWLPACFVGQSTGAKFSNPSTIDVVVTDVDGKPLKGVILRVRESGLRYIVPLPWASPAWRAQGESKSYVTSAEGKAMVEFRDEACTFETISLEGNEYVAKSSAKDKKSLYYVAHENRWWAGTIVEAVGQLTVLKEYAPDSKTLLGHRYEIRLSSENAK